MPGKKRAVQIYFGINLILEGNKMAITVFEFHTPYILESLFQSEKLQALMSSGALDVQTIEAAASDSRGIYGDYVNVPRLVPMPALTRVDIASTSTAIATSTEVSSNNQKFPVLHSRTGAYFNRYDEIRTGEKFAGSLEQSFGQRVSQRTLELAGLSLSGGLAGQASTPHTHDKTGSLLTIDMFAAGRALLEDFSTDMGTALVHPHVWEDLKKDMRNTYKYVSPSGVTVITGEIPGIVGVQNIIVTKELPVTTGITAVDIYESFILGPGSLFFAHQALPTLSIDKIVNREVPVFLLAGLCDLVIGARGTTWTGSAGPTDAQLATAGNWDESWDDARTSPSVKILSAAGNGTGVAKNT
ncbi:MAG: major capsid protein [candidate division Zixibacteria bacterium]